MHGCRFSREPTPLQCPFYSSNFSTLRFDCDRRYISFVGQMRVVSRGAGERSCRFFSRSITSHSHTQTNTHTYTHTHTHTHTHTYTHTQLHTTFPSVQVSKSLPRFMFCCCDYMTLYIVIQLSFNFFLPAIFLIE